MIPEIANHEMDSVVPKINVVCNTKCLDILSEKPTEGKYLIPTASHFHSASSTKIFVC